MRRILITLTKILILITNVLLIYLKTLYLNKGEKGKETVEEKTLYDVKEEEQAQRKKMEWRDR